MQLSQRLKHFERQHGKRNGRLCAGEFKRTQLQACLEYVRAGDTLVVSRLDRLARSTLHFCQIANELERKGINLKVIDQNIDTSDATGRLLFNMLGAIAQFETEIRSERQMDGINKAKKAGISFGRKRALNPQQIVELKAKRESQVLVKDLMFEYRISEASIQVSLSTLIEKRR